MQLPTIDPDQPLSIQQAETVTGLPADGLDALPVGVIQVDPDGVILGYNATEERISGFVAANVIGKNFFVDVAPCTNVKQFAGRFRAGIEKGSLYETFPYTFEFPDRQMPVLITLYHAPSEPHAWIFVSVGS